MVMFFKYVTSQFSEPKCYTVLMTLKDHRLTHVLISVPVKYVET